MTAVIERPQTSNSSSSPYQGAILRLLDVTPQQARQLAEKLTTGSVVFSMAPLDLHPMGVPAATIEHYRRDAEHPDVERRELAQYNLDRSLSANAWRREAFGEWLAPTAASLPSDWRNYMLARLKPRVTYVRFMPHVTTLLVETD